MTSRARLFALVARAEAMRLAALARTMGQAQADLARAEAMEGRLRQVLTGLPRTSGPVSVAMLRDTGLMVSQLAAEAAHQQGAAQTARAQIDTIRVRISSHDQRRRMAEEAAQTARLAEAEALEARLDASRPVLRGP